jgi:hypothetical protein
MEPLSAKVVIAFFYLMHGDMVSYTVSDYVSFAQEENIPAATTCEALVRNVGFMESVRSGLEEGEAMRASCFLTEDIMVLGEPTASACVDAR